jgi:hypothetical protein
MAKRRKEKMTVAKAIARLQEDHTAHPDSTVFITAMVAPDKGDGAHWLIQTIAASPLDFATLAATLLRYAIEDLKADKRLSPVQREIFDRLLKEAYVRIPVKATEDIKNPGRAKLN